MKTERTMVPDRLLGIGAADKAGVSSLRLYLRLAWRNLWRHRRRTLIVFLAIGLGIAMMMLYDGLIAGFDQAIYGNAIRVLGGNIQVHASGYRQKADRNMLLPLENDQAAVEAALAQPNVLAAARRITTGGMATSREGAFPVSIVGIEPEKELPVNLIAQHVIAGRFLAAEDKEVIFIGKGLAEAMNVTVGSRITLVGRTLKKEMRRHTMTVVGVYDVGLREIEKRTVYMSLGEAQYLYELDGKSTEVVVTLEQMGQEAPVISALQSALPGYEIDSWETNFPELRAAISTKSGVMNIFSVIILIIAAIGILNLLLMAVYERTREIGLMAALGMRPRHISLVFLLEGAMMGLVGLVFGLALGLFFNGLLGQVGLDYSKFSNVTEYMALISGKVYPTLGLEKIWQRGLTVVIISILAAYYPAREAAHREPAEALHYV